MASVSISLRTDTRPNGDLSGTAVISSTTLDVDGIVEFHVNAYHPFGYAWVSLFTHSFGARERGKTDRGIDRQTDRQTDRGIDRQRNRQTDRQTDRQSDEQTDRPTDILTGRQDM